METLRSKELTLVSLEDKSQQIGIEGTGEDVQAMKSQVQTTKDAFNALKSETERAADWCCSLLAERRDFQRDLASNCEQLRQRLAEVKVNEPLGMDEAAIAQRLAKFLKIKEGLVGQMNSVKDLVDEQRGKFAATEETMPLELQDALEEYGKLQDAIKVSTCTDIVQVLC